MIGKILSAGDNVDEQEDFGFIGLYFKIASTVIDDYTKNKFLNMQRENLRRQINIENNDNKNDERYQEKMIDDKEYDERDQISESYKEIMIEDIEILKLQNLSSQKKYIS